MKITVIKSLREVIADRWKRYCGPETGLLGHLPHKINQKRVR
jgi:hypothetical protein